MGISSFPLWERGLKHHCCIRIFRSHIRRSPRGNIHWNCLIGCGIGKDRAMLVLSSDIVYPLYEEYTNNIEIKMKRACKSIRF